ncbi:MRN complex-interacting protein [Amborella trichopoda]|uniref:MRN complex-interacting protein n=1 Tax=Amborella trichopoda TaxID=13333 RepID=UPI0009BD8345|nr:MRN complex-interacting protein [Amborella trichopoda]|eukprot:XP_011622562.2 MRN complex-interacting protein [Amborella trichopoda]
MAMATAFIALQCCQCSTMQVKQQKKSSNKWVCVVCNQKQSILKVFARSFMAKDVRKFVQSCNMTRSFTDQALISLGNENQVPENGFQVMEDQFSGDIYSQSKWSEYLDEEDIKKTEVEEEEDRGDETPRIVTEYRKELFKRSKQRTSMNLQSKETRSNFKPVFSKRKERSTAQGSMASEPQNSLRKRPCKWSDYLEENGSQIGEFTIESEAQDCSGANVMTHLHDEVFEEDIHPDFK